MSRVSLLLVLAIVLVCAAASLVPAPSPTFDVWMKMYNKTYALGAEVRPFAILILRFDPPSDSVGRLFVLSLTRWCTVRRCMPRMPPGWMLTMRPTFAVKKRGPCVPTFWRIWYCIACVRRGGCFSRVLTWSCHPPLPQTSAEVRQRYKNRHVKPATSALAKRKHFKPMVNPLTAPPSM